MKPCSVETCDRQAKKRGWCERHYQRWLNYGDPTVLKRVVLQGTPEERFWPRVNKTATCWLWTAGTDGVGYGKFNDGSTIVRAHRFSYVVEHGRIPEGLDIDHICHVTLCVRPSHLRAVTNKQNSENLLDSRKNNATGFRGVSLHKPTGKYRAYVYHQRKHYHVGLYDTPEEAAEAARSLRLQLFTHSDMDRRAA